MKRLLLVLLALVSVSVVAQGDLSGEDIDRISRSVVQILVFDGDTPVDSGSGTIVEPTGLIYTNRHVADAGNDYGILMLDDIREQPVLRYFASATLISDQLDFAVLQIDRDSNGLAIDSSTLNLPVIPLATDEVQLGESVSVFGYPTIGEGFMVYTTGQITTIQNGNLNGARLPVWYQTNAEIAPGNSGGLAVNQRGELIGVPTAVITEERTGGRLGGILPLVAIQSEFNAQNMVNIPNQGTPNTGPSVPSQEVATGISVTCDNGASFDNGVEIVVKEMRAGFTYTATVLGIGSFDPVLAVLDTEGVGLCSDDATAAGGFTVDLPTTGVVAGSGLSSQVQFTQNSGQALADVSLVVGGFDNAAGEFVLLLEGMAATPDDVVGDPFVVRVTPGMTSIPLTVYMISESSGFDPYFYLSDTNYNVWTDDQGSEVRCDDAGSPALCWGESEDLSSSFVTLANGSRLPGFQYDAMMSIALDGLIPENNVPIYLNFVMTSYQQQSSDRYVLVFHAATR